MVKRIISFLAAIALVLAILLTVVADVNHGHGPGHHGDEHGGHGEETHEHSEGHDEHDEGHESEGHH